MWFPHVSECDSDYWASGEAGNDSPGRNPTAQALMNRMRRYPYRLPPRYSFHHLPTHSLGRGVFPVLTRRTVNVASGRRGIDDTRAPDGFCDCLSV